MKKITYKEAGVNIDAANEAKHRIKNLARKTFNSQVLTEIGSFGALFRTNFSAMKDPVLVASTDGVGTKLKIAFMTGIHNTIGYDLVAHCIDDIAVQGAKPLFFMDYIATGELSPNIVAEIIEGIARACSEANCPLIGGETAEMPGFYAAGEYDVAGFIVGIVDREKIIDGTKIKPGDQLIGLPSLGLHTNGYSLARKLFFEVANLTPNDYLDELGNTVAESLLKPHKNYFPVLSELFDQDLINGLAHITGGGFLENIPRVLPENCQVEIKLGSWPVLPVFNVMQKIGNIEKEEMYRVFNMGIGMIVVVSNSNFEKVMSHFQNSNEPCYHIGQVVTGENKVNLLPAKS
ncbi:MAG: phosphoribosylformylglycinamidine cyclo-ligase [Acidobacteria bacterium]|nr:phosphoribosylformylglycinamidine cyclo-ligase [Acidobacteriota bacterium]